MTMTSVLPWLAAALLAIFAVTVATSSRKSLMQRAWLIPAGLSLIFLAFSAYAAVVGGPTGFWTEHIRNYWGNQIWFDLLLAVGIGWFLIVPQAKEAGMRLLPWLLFVLVTGSIGFLAMLARLLYLRENAVNPRK